MDAFSYTDIFDTKGIEYLVVIGFLLILIPAWIWLNRPVKTTESLIRSVQGLTASLLKIPHGLYYSPNHTWVYKERDGNARIGVDDLLLHLTGGVSVDFLVREGDRVKKGDRMARISSEDRMLWIGSPISGEVENLNKILHYKTGMINSDPYKNGWICSMKPAHWKEEVKKYHTDKEAEAWEERELERCKNFLYDSMAAVNGLDAKTVLQTGGELADFPLSEFPPEIWNKFQEEFLD